MADLISSVRTAKHIHSIGARPLEARPFASLWRNTVDLFEGLGANPRMMFITLASVGVVGVGVYNFGDGVGRPEIATTAAVTGVRHQPAHYTTQYYTDSDGRQHSRQVYHPDEYHAKIVIPQSNSEKVVTLSRSEYEELYPMVNHPTVTYKAVYREGRWSHKATWIDLDNPLRQANTQERQASLKAPGPGQAKNSTGSW